MWPNGDGLLLCRLRAVEDRGRLSMCLFLGDVGKRIFAMIEDDKPCNVN